MLQPRYGGAFARPFTTHHNELERDFYLRIATELYLKRLIVGGLERVYEIGKDFRNEGVSHKHQPEFTMLEWYEAYADYRDAMVRIEQLVEAVALEVIGTTSHVPGTELELAAPWREGCGCPTRSRPKASGRVTRPSSRPARGSRHRLQSRRDLGPSCRCSRPSSSRAWFSRRSCTTIRSSCRPWRPNPDVPTLVERFEYFIGGKMEIGNAFSEINDALEQAARFEMQQAERESGDTLAEEGVPITSRRSRAECRRPAGSAWASIAWRWC